ncbi:MAG: hypothetical protein MJ158_00795 [Alphaproteobacteria bacterium]|nr:hypothetical protein [Alphaproteobacteria bacterium]
MYNQLKTCCKNALAHSETVCPNCGTFLTSYYQEMAQRRINEFNQRQR